MKVISIVVIGEFDPITEGQIESLENLFKDNDPDLNKVNAIWLFTLPHGRASLRDREEIIRESLLGHPRIVLIPNNKNLDTVEDIYEYSMKILKSPDVVYIFESELTGPGGSPEIFPEVVRMNLRHGNPIGTVPEAFKYILEKGLYK